MKTELFEIENKPLMELTHKRVYVLTHDVDSN